MKIKKKEKKEKKGYKVCIPTVNEPSKQRTNGALESWKQ
jgi:hypothetical protein